MSSSPAPQPLFSGTVRIAVLTVAGLVVASFAGPAIAVTGWAAVKKVKGLASECGWSRIASMYWDNERFTDRYDEYRTQTEIVDRDEAMGLILVKFHGEQFWIKEVGEDRTRRGGGGMDD